MTPGQVVQAAPPTRVPTYLGAALRYVWTGFVSILLLPLVLVSMALVVVWVGVPMLAGSLSLVRRTSMQQRRIVLRLFGGRDESPYRPVDGLSWGEALRVRLTDATTYRDLLWLPLAAGLGLAVGITTLVFYLVFPLGLFASPMILRLWATLSSVVLRQADTERLAARIGELSRSRAETVDTQAAELRRIERDLHDGAQAHLVALSMNLGLAEQLMARDPDASKELLAESRASVGTALHELRQLVRGIHPPVLADRGLVGGVEALALACPLPVDTDLHLDARPPAPVESAVYFAVAELLTNAAKHSGAADVWVWLRYDDDRLRVTVGDNGRGGAEATEGGGLHGLQRRLAAFDGIVGVTSPVGGPTVITLEVPCALSSPKTSRSSGTA